MAIATGLPNSGVYWLSRVQPPNEVEERYVICDFDAKVAAAAKVAGLVPDQKVKIKGNFRLPNAGTPSLEECELLASGPDTAIKITAANLSKEFATDQEAALKKYKGKQVVLVGVVVAAAPKDALNVLLESFDPKAEKPMRVSIQFPSWDEKFLRKLKEGDKVIARGRCRGIELDNVKIVADGDVKLVK